MAALTSQAGPIIILGMHRSGTSFATRALNLAGLWLGKDETLASIEGRAFSGNPKGNYENREIIRINDDLLENSGGSWNHIPYHIDPSKDQLTRMENYIRYLTSDRPEVFPRWGWKDPRTIMTLDIWKEIVKPQYLICMIRHPRLVADSLFKRNRMPYSDGFHLWHIYNLKLLEHITRYPSIILRFDTEADELLNTILLLCEKIGLNDASLSIRRWYDTRLIRSKMANKSSPTPNMVCDLWYQLLEIYKNQKLH